MNIQREFDQKIQNILEMDHKHEKNLLQNILISRLQNQYESQYDVLLENFKERHSKIYSEQQWSKKIFIL